MVRIHCPGSGARASASMRWSTSSIERAPPSEGERALSPSRSRWAWASISPGTTVRPARSTRRVCGPASASTSAVVPTARILSPLTATASATRAARSSVRTVPPGSTRAAGGEGSVGNGPPVRVDAVGDAVGRGDERALLRLDRDVVEAGAPSLLPRAGLGDEGRVGAHRGQEADGHAEGHGGPPVGITRGAEGDVGQREDDAPVRMALEVDHVGPQLEAHATGAPPQIEEGGAEGARPGGGLEPAPGAGPDGPRGGGGGRGPGGGGPSWWGGRGGAGRAARREALTGPHAITAAPGRRLCARECILIGLKRRRGGRVGRRQPPADRK